MYKRIIYYLIVSMLISSCSTTEKFVVRGIPGTEIYHPNKELIGTIPTDGKLKVALSSDEYCALLLAKAPTANIVIPFALDYKKASRFGTSVVEYVGGTLAIAGLTGEVIGLVATIDGAEDVGTPFFAVGSALGGAGAAMAIPASYRNQQVAYQNQFTYLKSQRTNDDLPHTECVIPLYAPPVDTIAINKSSRIGRRPSGTLQNNSSKSKRHIGQKSTRKLKSMAQMIENQYNGSGVLSIKDEPVEKYNNIKVYLKADQAPDSVFVWVEDADGVGFFEEENRYVISRQKNGGYLLLHESIPQAKITIDKNNQLVYIHPRVNIDGNLYTLRIQASLDK